MLTEKIDYTDQLRVGNDKINSAMTQAIKSEEVQMVSKEEEIEEFDFLKAIYGDKIPADLRKEVFPNGVIGYYDGKPNIKKIVEMALALMSQRYSFV